MPALVSTVVPSVCHPDAVSVHQALLEWLILLGVFVLLTFVAWHEGLLLLLFSSDRSYLSWLICALFVVMTGHCGMRAFSISTLRSQAEAAWHWRDTHPGTLIPAGDTLAVGEARMPVTRITRSAAELLCFPAARRELLEILGSEVKGGQDVGWYVSESMIRLGLLGDDHRVYPDVERGDQCGSCRGRSSTQDPAGHEFRDGHGSLYHAGRIACEHDAVHAVLSAGPSCQPYHGTDRATGQHPGNPRAVSRAE